MKCRSRFNSWTDRTRFMDISESMTTPCTLSSALERSFELTRGKKKIPSVNWHSDDRPIFFIELRERYVCTWCEMHDGRLILIPTQQSKRRSQQVRYPAEATIIGRV